ncbi:MAG: hypothetical protein ACAI38_06155 [Myxococcota bacterium]
MSAIPPVSARPAVQPGAQPVPPEGVPPGSVRQPPPADAAAIERQQHTTGLVAGSVLTASLFVGAGLAMCVPFLGFMIPFLIAGGILTGVDFLADMAGFSPVKMLTGKSIGGWIASAFSARPTEPDRPQGVNVRRGPQPQQRAPVEVAPLEPPPRRDGEPEPVPVS